MKDIRELTGISQQQLADYLGVPRSQVALAESKHRSLSTAALIKAGPMILALQQKKEVPQLAIDKEAQTISLNKKLERRKKTCDYLAENARIKLEDMQRQYNQCSNALQMVNELLAKLPDDEQHKTSRLVLEIIERKTMEKLKGCGLEAQTMLQLYIDMLVFEVGKVERIIK